MVLMKLACQTNILYWLEATEEKKLLHLWLLDLYLCRLEFQGFLDIDDEISIKCTLQQYRQDFYEEKIVGVTKAGYSRTSTSHCLKDVCSVI